MDIQVFFVNRGDMLLFDLSHAMQSVKALKRVIEKNLGIPVSNQVLLMSGGGVVDSDQRVCTYTSGK
ncbi:hypothetical protein EB796_001212 [Bugula neritina]|uniref:Ubiquitin-like domain-containing protein n=1 Tax=Bugula neritina TaxID=10212 RepID=A0A7J7KQN5_BUGNE|nr:hypothetical protein EB796_001212 [Bugula neritina]